MKRKITNIMMAVFAFVIVCSLFSCEISKKIKVQFETNGGTVVSEITITENTTIAQMPTEPTKEGYVFDGWYTDQELLKVFVNSQIIPDSLTLYAKWAKLVEITFDSMGGSKVETLKIKEGEKATLPTVPTKVNTNFGGWYTTNTYETLFDFTKPVTSDVTLYAKWVMQMVVSFDSKEGSTVNPQYLSVGDKAVKPADPTKEGSNFLGWYTTDTYETLYDFTQDVNTNLVLFARWEVKTYTITFNFENGQKEEFVVSHGDNFVDYPLLPTKEGFVSTWSTYKLADITSDRVVDLVFVEKDSVTRVEVKDTNNQPVMVKETLVVNSSNQDRYLFYSDSIISFSGAYASVEVLNNKELASSTDDVLTVNHNEGSFLLKCTLDDGRSAVFYCVVLPKITGFNFDGGLSEYTRIKENIATSDYLVKEVANYLVGCKNPFQLEYSIYSGVTLLDSNKTELKYSYEVLNGTEFEAINEDEILVRDGNQLQFKESTIGKVFRITVEPVNSLSTHGNEPISAVVEINEGVNVHNHQELKVAYADLKNTLINIHNNIEATLSDEQLNPNKSPINYDAHYQLEALKAGLPTGDVYVRYSDNVTNNHLVVNGNYFKIDGSSLPVVQYGGYANQPSYVSKISESLYVSNVQVGIFYNALYKTDVENANNLVTYNNLTILGNTITPDVNYNQEAEKVKTEEELMSYNSGGYIGITNRYSGTETNNTNIGYAVIGVTCLFKASNATLNNTFVYYSWANGCYGHGVDFIDLNASYIKYSGGAAVHIEDTEIKGDEANDGCNDPMVFIDKETVIENWVSGEEAWFKAYDLNALIPTLKANFEGGLNTFGASMLETKEFNNNGKIEKVEMFNFTIFARHSMDPETFINAGPQYRFNVDDVEIARSYDFRTKSFVTNILTAGGAGGAYFFPVGDYSDESVFMTYVNEIATQYIPIFMGQGMSQEQAQATAIGLAMKNAYQAQKTKYVELLYNIPVFGEICFITGYSMVE